MNEETSISVVRDESATCPTFLFEDHDVRIKVDECGVLWFVARDVAEALGITWSGQTLSKIPDSWVTMLELNMVTGRKEVVGINEAAVYKLAFRSNKPAAERFTDWIASELLPSIRKTGQYSLNSTPVPQATIYKEVASKVKCGLAAGKAYKGLAKLLGCSESLANAQMVQYLKREIDLDTTLLLSENIADTQDPLVIPSEIGSEMGISPKKVNLILQDLGLQIHTEYESKGKTKKKWEQTEKGAEFGSILDVGKKHSDGAPVQQIKWFKNRTMEKMREYL